MQKLKITEMQRLGTEEYIKSKKLPLTIVLDDLRSMNNVGSIFRTADAFRLEGICLCGITARPPHPDIHKTALGAEESVPWQYYPSTMAAVEDLLYQGYSLCAVEQAHGSISLETFHPEIGKRYALILGNEVKGVRQNVINMCNCCLEIPQFGTKHSLNVSVTAGIVIWQMVAPMLSLLRP
ncbi:RNA methyltransferase [Porphyromonas loveana]|uniref:RNA methyltransferase n=1 Tax=Porphyromonas loveana TaxID=1884669 RepID=UPI0035A146E2